MEKTILVTGKDTFLGNEISKFFLGQGARVGVSITPRNQDSHPSLEQDERLLTVPWYRRSSISAKNLVLQTVNQLGPLDEAWIIFTQEHEKTALGETSASVLEESLDESLKGLVFLTRELLLAQAARPEFRLIFVFFDEDRLELDPLCALQYEGAKAFVSSVLANARRKNHLIWAYEAAHPQADAFAQFVLSHPRNPENKTFGPGRWSLFEEKKNLFSGFFPKRNDA